MKFKLTVIETIVYTKEITADSEEKAEEVLSDLVDDGDEELFSDGERLDLETSVTKL